MSYLVRDSSSRILVMATVEVFRPTTMLKTAAQDMVQGDRQPQRPTPGGRPPGGSQQPEIDKVMGDS